MAKYGPKPYVTLERLYDILDHMVQEPNTGCKVWEGPLSGSGYGRYGQKSSLGESVVSRHVLTRKLARPIRAGCLACHTCDTPSCVEETHIYEGTPQSNMDDRTRRGRIFINGIVHWSQREPHKVKRGVDHPINNRKREWNFARGDSHTCSKLTEAAVRDIKANYVRGLRGSAVGFAIKYGVGKGTVSSVIQGRTWRHVK